MKSLFAVSGMLVFFITVTAFNMQARADAEKSSCSEIIRERNDVFDENKLLLKDIAHYRAAVAVFEQRVAVLSGGAQKAANRDLGRAREALTAATAHQEKASAKLKHLDAELAQCRTRRTESFGGKWAGTYTNPEEIVTLNASGRSISGTDKWHRSGANPENESGHSEYKNCLISGNTLTCDSSGVYENNDETVTWTGEMTFTLSGNTLSGVNRIKTSRQTWKNGDKGYSTKIQPGAEFPLTVTRH